MALVKTTIEVPTKNGSVRSYGRATHDLEDAGAELIAATVVSETTKPLHQAGAVARARVAAGVITVDVDGPVGAGTVAVLVTTET